MITLINPSNFRQAIVLATLSEKPLLIEGLHDELSMKGINNSEAAFLKLVELISNGSRIQISKNGSQVKYTPGLIVNSETPLSFDCGHERAIPYFLEPLVLLALYGKYPLDINLTGTNLTL